MTRRSCPPARMVVLCITRRDESLHALREELRSLCGATIQVEGFHMPKDALAWIGELPEREVHVPAVLLEQDLRGILGTDLLIDLMDRSHTRHSQKILISSSAAPEDVTNALNRGALNHHLPSDWDLEDMRSCVRSLLTKYLLARAPHEVKHHASVVDVGELSHALLASERSRQSLGRSFLADIKMSDDDVERAMIDGFDKVLGNPARRVVGVGETMLTEGMEINEIAILLRGEVSLTRKIGDREITIHTHSAGRIIGLMSLTQRKRVQFTCRAVTEVTIIPLTFDQLDAALSLSPDLSVHFVTVLIRSLAMRHQWAAALQLEVMDLNTQISGERDQLQDALSNLKKAQMRLVESERMATLGQLSAGVAHELNNPIAAVRRAADFIREDMGRILAELPGGNEIFEAITQASEATPTSTREMRRMRRELEAVVDGNSDLAERLVKAGITTENDFRAKFAGKTDVEIDQSLNRLERQVQMGASLRNLVTCADRVTGLVNSLRSYSRTDEGPIDNIDLHVGLEDTLTLFGKRLRSFEVLRNYGDLPLIECHAGEINQVWTNLVSNAIEAMGDKGTLEIRTDAPSANSVRVRITDSGKGISPANLAHVFDLNFTTRQGPAQFGLGMGLAICQEIVRQHGGEISVTSEPGKTTFTITLPIRIPSDGEESSNR